MAEIGWASLGIIPTFDKFGRELEQGSAKHLAAAGTSGGTKFGDAAGKSAGSRFGSIFKTAAKAALIGVAGAGALAVKFGADAVSAASDLEESSNKLDQVFGKSSGTIVDFAENAAKQLGQTNLEARNAAATFGIFGKAANLQGKSLTRFAGGMTALASDMASFHNTSPEEAIEALGSGLRGEAEPLRKYGILLDDAALKAEALALGLLKPVKDQAKIQAYNVKILEGQKKYNEAVKEHGAESLEALKAEASLGTAREQLRKATEGSIPALTQEQKILAARSAIVKQSSDVVGDFARTSGGLANQQRILKARLEDTKAEIGASLLPVVTDVVSYLNDKGVPAFERFADWFTNEGVPAIGDFADKARPLVNELLPAMGTTLGDVRDILKPAAEHAVDLVKAFNDMPDWAKTAIVGGGASLLVGRKLGFGKLAGKTAGSLIQSTKPVPVIVMNEGFGGAGGAGAAGGRGGKFAKGAGGALAITGGVSFLASGVVGNTYGSSGAAGIGDAGGVAAAARDFDKLTDGIDNARTKHGLLRNDLTKAIKLNVDNLPVRQAIDETQRLIRLIETANSMNVRHGGAAAAKNAKLHGDSYGSGGVTVQQMNFNGVDLPAAKREMAHVRRTAALGGADFE